ncbi:MAG: cytochrome c biogenesis protein ResB [bacterium]|nr:cytochrome c biogenesis protein ResB [bacterium]
MISPLERAQQLVFYSLWYRWLLVLMAVNVSAATVFTVFTKILPSYKPRFAQDPRFYETAACRGQINYAGTAEGVAAALRGEGFRTYHEGPYGYAIHGRLGRWGAPVSHLGVVILLLGGFASAWVAREGQITLVEGQTTDHMEMQGVSQPVPLGFTIRCDDFDTAFFPRTQTPSRFTSYLTAFVAGQPPRAGVVEVNQAMVVQGWKLHQASYQEMEGMSRYRVAVGVTASRPTTVTLELTPGQSRPVPGQNGVDLSLSTAIPSRWTISRDGKAIQEGSLGASAGKLLLTADQFEPDFVIGADRTAGSRSQELNNPALHVTLIANGQRILSQWLFGREDMKSMVHQAGAPYELELKGIQGEGAARRFVVSVTPAGGPPLGQVTLALNQTAALAPPPAAAAAAGPWRVRFVQTVPLYATVLTVSRNPALPVVYGGCLVMMIGLVIAFFNRRREVWYWVDSRRGRLRLAAAYPQPREQLDRATSRALERLSNPTQSPPSPEKSE